MKRLCIWAVIPLGRFPFASNFLCTCGLRCQWLFLVVLWWLPHQAGVGAGVSDLYLSRTAAKRQLSGPTTTKLRWRCQLLAVFCAMLGKWGMGDCWMANFGAGHWSWWGPCGQNIFLEKFFAGNSDILPPRATHSMNFSTYYFYSYYVNF